MVNRKAVTHLFKPINTKLTLLSFVFVGVFFFVNLVHLLFVCPPKTFYGTKMTVNNPPHVFSLHPSLYSTLYEPFKFADDV